jgi:prenyltransferase beta subunit
MKSAAAIAILVSITSSLARAQERLPLHVTAPVQKSVNKGLDWLAEAQGQDGNFPNSADGQHYPVAMTSLAGMAFLASGNTPSRGPYAENIHRAMLYVMDQAHSSGLLASPAEFNSMSMHGHGFALLFLASSYGMETDEKIRAKLKVAITKAVELTAQAQSPYGGWTYVPGGGDEGSVTVTQIQGLRAAQNAGFTVPKGTIEAAVKYLELCRNPDGGIVYSYGSGGPSRLAISAAAIATLYNAGDYDSKMADSCLDFVAKQFDVNKKNWSKGGGHDYYTHLYAAQAFYQAGEKYWNDYFPGARDQLIRQQTGDGSWSGDGIGPVYGTSIALVILQLPYKLLPIYQR